MPDQTAVGFLQGALRNVTISDLGSYYEVRVQGRDIQQLNNAGFTISTMVSKPVCIIRHLEDKAIHTDWWDQGLRYNPFNGPASERISQLSYTKRYHLPNEKEGRLDGKGPSYIHHLYGNEYRETWKDRTGVLHRVDGPAEIDIRYGALMSYRDYVLTTPKSEEVANYLPGDTQVTTILDHTQLWYRNGKPYRNQGWNQQIDNNIAESINISSGSVLTHTVITGSRELRWYTPDGKLHRSDGPAVIKLTDVREVHRDSRSTNWQFSTWKTEWWVNGEEIPYLRISQWAKKNRFGLHNHPCYDSSAFRTAEAEVCFVSDFC